MSGAANPTTGLAPWSQSSVKGNDRQLFGLLGWLFRNQIRARVVR
ncbi:hypothetical protein [Nocardiopsis sp. CNR-923]|nr:hypothetical protein [Nocardiopsis sp. CNR-923]